MNSKLAVGRIEGNHFSREVRRHTHPFPRRKNVEIIRLKNQTPVGSLMTDFPELLGWIVVDSVQFDGRSIALRLVGNDFAGFSGFEIDSNSQAPVKAGFYGDVLVVHVDERFLLIQPLDRAVTCDWVA